MVMSKPDAAIAPSSAPLGYNTPVSGPNQRELTLPASH